jgi:hypothetical protein
MRIKLLHSDETLTPDPYPKIIMIHKLYFPEIKDQMDVFISARDTYYGWLLKGMKDIQTRITPTNLKPAASEKNLEQFGQYYAPVVHAITNIEDACSKIMEKLIWI